MALSPQSRRRNDDGFTLIELLIVIIILGVLAAIVVFSVRGITDKGEESACKTSKATVATAYEAMVASFDPPSGAPLATAATLADLHPEFLHEDNVNIKGTDYPAATTVSTIDAIVC